MEGRLTDAKKRTVPMKDLFSKKAILKLRELYRKSLISTENENGINIVWLSPNFSEDQRHKPNLKMHWHTFYEIHFVLDGSATYQTKDKSFFTVNAGEFLFIPPGNKHMLVCESSSFKKLGLTFSCSDTKSESYVFKNGIFCGSIDDFVKNSLSNISYALESGNGAEVSILKNCLFALILHMAVSVITKNEEFIAHPSDERVARAKRFIEDNAIRDISVGEAAAYVYLSSKQFGRLFKRHEHITVVDFIAKCRCDKAKILLKDKNIPISEIAENLSFSNEYNFNRFFKRVEGVTPGAYRMTI